jgi:hypothetical protein
MHFQPCNYFAKEANKFGIDTSTDNYYHHIGNDNHFHLIQTRELHKKGRDLGK